jgi:hypothetical protein
VPPRARREYVLVAAVWAAWLVAVLGVVAGGTAGGAITDPHHSWPHYGGPFWPLFIWDYGWYEVIAIYHYPAHVTAPVYAFFPLWPLILRASGAVADWAVGFGVAIAASAVAFAGVATAIPSGRRLRAAVGMAIWPGSFVLLLAYPDVIAVAAGAWAAALILRGRPWLAGAFAAVAAFARPTGFLLAIPLLFAGRVSVRGRVFAVLAPIAAAAAVHVYFWRRSGDALAFLHAESLPVWSRKGPQRLAKWPGELAHALHVHAALVIPAAFVGIAVIALVYRRFGVWYAAAVAYVFAVAAALLGAQTTPTRIQSAILALTVLGIAYLWYRGRTYWPWALFATAVIAVSVFSGSVTSLGRQAVFAFPLFWTVADAPRPARHPVILVAAAAANLAYALTLARYAP